MKKLDHAQFSYVEIDPQALETVRGGVLPDPPIGVGATDPSKPVGKGRKILCGLGLLGCTILGPEAPDPGETGLGGVGGPPKGRPPAGAPPTPGPNKLTPLLGLNAG